MLRVKRNCLTLRAWKSIIYARSRKTANASSSKNLYAETMAMPFISQSRSFKITMSKSGTVIGMCSCWNAKGADDGERPAARCAPDRDRRRYRLGLIGRFWGNLGALSQSYLRAFDDFVGAGISYPLFTDELVSLAT
jgi:hypothetical protein